MTRKTISLNGTDWKFKKFKENKGVKAKAYEPDYNYSDWKNAKVPGNVRLDLLSNEEIADPFFGKNFKDSEWIEEFEWWYRKDFELLDLQSEIKDHTFQLIFEGVDYLADFWLNGKLLGSHEGMFGKIKFNLENIRAGNNSLIIRLAPIKKYKKRLEVLKCQMSFGWDIAPKLKTTGIWDDVYIHILNKIHFHSNYITTELDNNEAKINFQIKILNEMKNENLKLRILVKGKNFECEPNTNEFNIELQQGLNKIKKSISLINPKLWYPWDKGEPNLYQTEIELIKDEKIIDSISDTFGIRKIEFLRTSDNPEHIPWIFQINGLKEYIRGTNWIPPDALFGRINKERYEKNLKLAKEANINLIRIWGGGLREKKEFYDICDELGLLVWQEFPIACVQNVGINVIGSLPKDEKYLNLFQSEANSIVLELRNHPSLVVWCGGNEFNAKDNKHIIDILEKTIQEFDPSRVFIKTSPYGGDIHNYDIWHGMAPYSRYLDDDHPFCSEFGMSSFPNISTIKKFLPEDEMKPFGKLMELHAPYVVKTNAHFHRIKRYTIPLKPNDSLESIVEASQIAQGLAYKTAIEHYRRMKWKNAGVAFWQFDDCWPGVCFSIVDYYYEPKISFQYIKQAYQQLLVSLKYDLTKNYNIKDKTGKFKHKFEGGLFLINDYSKDFENLELKINIIDNDKEISSERFKIERIEKDSCLKFKDFKFEIPPNMNEAPKIELLLMTNGQIVSKNIYDLSYYDEIQLTGMAKLNNKITYLLFEGTQSKTIRYFKLMGYAFRIAYHLLKMMLIVSRRWKKREKKKIIDYPS
ncbi:MAG: glycoside hydrolase family 2 protein [Candidatus Helarchaeota archaeon]